MADFQYSDRDIWSEASFADAIILNQKNRNPKGNTPLKTTASQNPSQRTGITSTTVAEILQGVPVYRNQGYTADAFNQTLSSDLAALLKSEGGPEQILGGRIDLLASDALSKQGFTDGRFDVPSGLEGGLAQVTSNTSAQNPRSAPATHPVGSKTLLAAGDSVMSGLADYGVLQAKMPEWQITPGAKPSRKISQQIQALETFSGTLPESCAMIMGHNADNQGTIQQDIDKVMSLLSSMTVVLWVTVTEWSEYSRIFNEQIWAAKQRYPNVEVLDWAIKTATDKSLLADHVHPNAAGNEVLAGMIAGVFGVT